jgi:hypothetical protein
MYMYKAAIGSIKSDRRGYFIVLISPKFEIIWYIRYKMEGG